MLIIKAIALHCVIAHGHYTLDKPVLVDDSGCKTLTVRNNYIEYGVVNGKRIKRGLGFVGRWVLGGLNWDENIEINLNPDRTLPPGYTKKGCALGWTPKNEMSGSNMMIWCDPPPRRNA